MGSGALPSPEFSLNARIPTLPNCVQEGDLNLPNTALQNCTTSSPEGWQSIVWRDEIWNLDDIYSAESEFW